MRKRHTVIKIQKQDYFWVISVVFVRNKELYICNLPYTILNRVAMYTILRYYVDVSTLALRVLTDVRRHRLFNQERRNGMAANLQPLADRVLVKPIEKEEMTKSGIYLPDTAKEKPQEGEVLAVGPGKISDDGKRIEMDLKVGDIVIYAKYGGTEIKVDDEELMVLRESDILAKKPK